MEQKSTPMLKSLTLGVIFIASLIIIFDKVERDFGRVWDGAEKGDGYGGGEYADEYFTDPACNVAGVAFRGDLYTYYNPELQSEDNIASSEDIIWFLEEAEKVSNIEVIILEVDSWGGSPVAAEELAHAIRQRITKPVIAQIREAGTSAAYWAASAADRIFASAISDVGSIGVTYSYIDQSKLNEQEGYTFNQVSTGKFKDYMNPEKPLTDEERALLERDAAVIHDIFVREVAEHRGMSVEEVQVLADGSSLPGVLAKDAGLIDEIGGLYEIENYIRNAYNIEPNICW